MNRDLPFNIPVLTQALRAEDAMAAALAARQQGELALALAHALLAYDAAPVAGLRASAGMLAGFCHFRLGQYRPLQVLGEALLGQVREPLQRMSLLRWVTLAAAHTGHFSLGLSCGAEAITLAEDIGDDAAQTAVRQAMARCFERMGDPWRAEQLLNEALPQAEGQPVVFPLLSLLQQLAETAIDEFHLVAPGRPGRTNLQGQVGHQPGDTLARAAGYARRAQAVAARVGDQHFHSFIDGLVGEALLHQGALDDAWPLLERAQCQAQAHGRPTLAWRCSGALAEGLMQRGDALRAARAWQALLDDTGGELPHTLQCRAHQGLAQASDALGQPERAVAHQAQLDRLHQAQSAWRLRRGLAQAATADAAHAAQATSVSTDAAHAAQATGVSTD